MKNNSTFLFFDTLKTFFTKTSCVITLILFLIVMPISIILLPKLILDLPQGVNPNTDQYISNSYGFILTIFVVFTTVFSNLIFDVNEVTFIFTSPISRNKFFSWKLFSQIFLMLLLSTVSILCWFILDKAFFPSKVNPNPHFPVPPNTIFETGLSQLSIIIPYLLIPPACSFLIATLKWFKKEWIGLAFLPILTLILITPYLMFAEFGLHEGNNIAPYVKTSTFIIPTVFFSTLILFGVPIFFLVSKYTRVSI